MEESDLTSTSFIVLGLVERAGEATPYDLKQMVAGAVGNFWSVPHSQLYAEPARLAARGHLEERREEGGRRRRVFTITTQGARVLERWRQTPSDDLPELRDPGLLRLFFGADPRVLAATRRDAHRRKLEQYEALRSHRVNEGPQGPWLTLDAGLAHEREWVRFWAELADDDAKA